MTKGKRKKARGPGRRVAPRGDGVPYENVPMDLRENARGIHAVRELMLWFPPRPDTVLEVRDLLRTIMRICGPGGSSVLEQIGCADVREIDLANMSSGAVVELLADTIQDLNSLGVWRDATE